MTSMIFQLEVTAEAEVTKCVCPEVPDGEVRGLDPDPDCPVHQPKETT